MSELKAAQDYKRQLELSIEKARLKLAPEDFQAMSPGLFAELNRVEQELEQIRLRNFMGCSSSEPIVPLVVRFCTNSRTTIRENVQSLAWEFKPYFQPTLDMREYVQSVDLSLGEAKHTSMIMNRVLALT